MRSINGLARVVCILVANLLWQPFNLLERYIFGIAYGVNPISLNYNTKCDVLYRKGDKAFFVFGFPKSEQDNIRDDEAIQFKQMAKQVLALTDVQLQQLVDRGQFQEIAKHA